MQYADLINLKIPFKNEYYGIDVAISHENGYAGFTSKIGETLFVTP
jgi:hypothetical protein